MLSQSKFIAGTCIVSLFFAACKIPQVTTAPQPKPVPVSFGATMDTSNSSTIHWSNFIGDKYLEALIDSALKNNQELAITLQEIEIARNEVRIKDGAILPRVEAGGGLGIDKVARYTSQGAGDASTKIVDNKDVPDWLPDFRVGVTASWEADIWKKLRTAKKAAVSRFLATSEGRNFIQTNLVAEISNAYYELLALDNQQQIVQQTIKLQQNALAVLKVQKQAAAATELAVKKFQGEVLGSQSMQYEIAQKIVEKENEINFLLGRFPQPIIRDTSLFLRKSIPQVKTGIPTQLLLNRPDLKQAELELEAARLDVKVARAEFLPSLDISAGGGIQAFNPKYFFKFPESLLFSLAGDLAGPIINRKAIEAEFFSANARQHQALYNYERNILNAYLEVSTSIADTKNQQHIFDYKLKKADTLTASIDIADALFKNARADYLEVLLTQRDALDAKLELVESKLRQFNAATNLYRALGGGWK